MNDAVSIKGLTEYNKGGNFFRPVHLSELTMGAKGVYFITLVEQTYHLEQLTLELGQQ